MNAGNTEFIPFCGWYKCRSCGVTEHFIPSQCPVCLKYVENYADNRTQQIQEEMKRIRESEEDISW